MQNEAAKIVAESILGVDFRTILINNKPYTIYPPTIKIICRGVMEWSKLNINLDDQNLYTLTGQIPENNEPILRGLSYFIIGDVKGYKWKAFRLYRKLRYGTPSIRPDEMKEAVQVVFDLIQVQDFFDCATSCKNVAKTVATPK